MLSDADFKAGLWIRTVSNLPEELKILRKREKYTSVEWRLSHTPVAQATPLFTPYSPASFMVEGINAEVFCQNSAGVIFGCANPPAHFYDGCSGERLTRTDDGDLNYNKEKLDNGTGRTHQLHFPSSVEIRELLRTRYEEECAGTAGSYAPDEEPCLHWNEGLLRYGFKDIRGIYFDLDDSKICKQALLMRAMLDRVGGVHLDSLEFYQFKNGRFIHTQTRDVEEGAAADTATRRWSSEHVNTALAMYENSERNRQYKAVSLESGAPAEKSLEPLPDIDSSVLSSRKSNSDPLAAQGVATTAGAPALESLEVGVSPS